MNEIVSRFGEDKAKFKAYVKDLRKYNDILEQVLIIMAKTIQSEFIGKPITRAVTNKLNAIIGDKVGMLELNKSEWTNEKYININLVAENITYKYECNHDLRACITFYHGSPSCKARCTPDNRFTEESVNEIIEIINYNRLKVAIFEDASKHFNQYIRLYEKAVNLFVRTMEGINPLFADINTAQNMSYCHKNIKNIELMLWEHTYEPTVPKLTLADVLK
jgi:hypothetical protein